MSDMKKVLNEFKGYVDLEKVALDLIKGHYGLCECEWNHSYTGFTVSGQLILPDGVTVTIEKVVSR